MTVDAPLGLRERKKEQTRRALEDAALDLFARQGFDRTTVDEIAAACDVSTRTFFRYFQTKEDVLLADRPERLAEVVAQLESRPASEPPFRSMRSAVEAMIGGYAEDRERLATRSRVIARTPSLRVHGPDAQLEKEQVFVDALARRDEGAGVPPRLLEIRLAVGAVGAAFRSAVDTWLAAGGTGDLLDTVTEAFDRLAGGLDSAR